MSTADAYARYIEVLGALGERHGPVFLEPGQVADLASFLAVVLDFSICTQATGSMSEAAVKGLADTAIGTATVLGITWAELETIRTAAHSR